MATLVPSGGSDTVVVATGGDGAPRRPLGRRAGHRRDVGGAPVAFGTVATAGAELSLLCTPVAWPASSPAAPKKAAHPTTATTVRTVRDIRGVRGMTRQRYRRSGRLRWQDPGRDPYSAAMGTKGTLDAAKVDALVARARREVDEGFLPSAQVALARDGELIVFETFGDATPDTRYAVFSCTKAFVAGAMWALIGDGLVDVSKPVVEYVPEFGTNGKDVITVEQVMLHTSGFPHAPLGPPQWATPAGRREAFARWRLNWEPGTSYEYHATSAHWVLSAIIENVTGADFRDVVEDRVTRPAGLPRRARHRPDAAGRHRRHRHGR